VLFYKNTQQMHEKVCVNSKEEIHISWQPPHHGWLVLNTDGAAKAGTGLTRCGGVIRDAHGNWIVGFAKNLGTTNAYIAELWGLYEGLKLANNSGVHQLEVQMDSSIVVTSIQHGKIGSTKGWSIIRKIKHLLNSTWSVRITHVYREANRCVDVLGNLGCTFLHGLHVFNNPPTEVKMVLDDDFRGVSFPRFVAL
jgi:ribonuclease HI